MIRGDGRVPARQPIKPVYVRVRGIHRPGEESMIGDIPYRFTVRPLTEDERGGYLVEFPDLPGCMADGDTLDEAIIHARDAMACWLQAMRDAGRPTPKPSRDAAA
jgi:predicted RNase H-like HicB family nuclease